MDRNAYGSTKFLEGRPVFGKLRVRDMKRQFVMARISKVWPIFGYLVQKSNKERAILCQSKEIRALGRHTRDSPPPLPYPVPVAIPPRAVPRFPFEASVRLRLDASA